MVWFVAIVIYVALSLVVAQFGQDRRAGYWGTLVLSLLLTPLIAGVMLMAFSDRSIESRDSSDTNAPPR